MALSGTEKVVHSSSTALYGALDNDNFFMYMGGLAAAVRNIDGTSPELIVTNTRDPGRPEMTPINEFIGTEFRSRYVNPKWIEGMKEEGYAGAGEMRAFVEYLWGWDATVTDVIDNAMWQESFSVYVEDKHNLGMKAFFEASSPFAYQDMTGRMVETIRKAYWDADLDTERRLLEEYIESVNTHGVGCSEFTCGNPRLLEYVIERGRVVDIPVTDLEAFQQAMEQAIGIDIATAARAAETFVRRNEAAPAYTENLTGFLMDESIENGHVDEPVPTPGAVSEGDWGAAWAGLPIVGGLLVWRLWRRDRKS